MIINDNTKWTSICVLDILLENSIKNEMVVRDIIRHIKNSIQYNKLYKKSIGKNQFIVERKKSFASFNGYINITS